MSFHVPTRNVAVVSIDGMTCNSCVQSIERNIGDMNGVESVRVSLEDKQSHIVYLPSKTDENLLVTEIENMGFIAFLKSVDNYIAEQNDVLTTTTRVAKFKVYGMTCESCVRSIQQNVFSITGVIDVLVSLDNKNASIKYNCEKTTPEAFVEAIENAGFQVGADNKVHNELDNTRKISIPTKGITFPSCVENVKQTVGSTNGVQKVHVELNSENTDVWYQPELVSPETLINLIQQMGFDATLPYSEETVPVEKSVVMSIDGMTCNSCVRSIEENIADLAGVRSINVSLEEKTGIIVYDSKVTDETFLRDAIDDMGFETSIKESSKQGTVVFTLANSFNNLRIC